MANTRVQPGGFLGAVLKSKPGAGAVPDVPVLVLIDPNGNLILTNDNGDGTSTLSLSPQQGATFRSNAGAAAPGQSLKTYAGTVSIASGATLALETVATGKTFYVTDIYIGSNTATQFSVALKAAGVDIFDGFCKGDTGPIQMAGMETQPSAGSGSAVTLVLGTAASTTAAYYIAGFEQ